MIFATPPTFTGRVRLVLALIGDWIARNVRVGAGGMLLALFWCAENPGKVLAVGAIACAVSIWGCP